MGIGSKDTVDVVVVDVDVDVDVDEDEDVVTEVVTEVVVVVAEDVVVVAEDVVTEVVVKDVAVGVGVGVGVDVDVVVKVEEDDSVTSSPDTNTDEYIINTHSIKIILDVVLVANNCVISVV